jgi:isoamylase
MRDVWPGKPYPRGATFDGVGVNFAVYSRVATRVEICLYDAADPTRERERFDLPETTDFVWHGYVPGIEPGTLYGLRVHGPYEPHQGHRCNPNKLLVDPYAKALWGEVDWKQPVTGYQPLAPDTDCSFDQRDSAAGVPKSVVVSDFFDWGGDRSPDHPWRSTVIYETHVKGFTKLHPEVPEELRGTYAGLAHPAAIAHLTHLGVTAVELLPVHEYTDDGFLQDKLLSNYWGYSTLGYFAPEQRYSSRRTPAGSVSDFKAMVKALHAAGIEVLLDVVYNHTCEGNHLGPTLSLRGIDNATYYWLMPEPRHYLDFTGTGNSLNASNRETARLIVDSLRYWVTEMHVDGFRFDLATTLGRVGRGEFDRNAPFFQIVALDPVISRVKLIAEPWDIGLGGYQMGNFPAPWREWNGLYRDALRRYWKGDSNLASEIGYRLSGSADLYQGERRQPQASINFVTAHDGFTLHDLVTYAHKHNDANGEDNRDGADDNQSWNCGVEGETDDQAVIALRERQKRNLLAALFTSQGVPMLLAGDEMGRTQGGNNNAYCQDNELSWVDWTLDDRRRRLLEFTRRLIAVRHRHPVLQRRRFFVGDQIWDSRSKDLTWLRPDSTEMTQHDWQKPSLSALGFVLGGDAIPMLDERGERLTGDSLLVMLNGHHEPLTFSIPAGQGGPQWLLELDTADDERAQDTPVSGSYELAPRSLVVLRQPLTALAAQEVPPAEAVAGAVGATPEAVSAEAGRQPDGARRRRRAGLLLPLFSIRAGSGWGLGEILDLPRMATWAHEAGFSVLQLLPVNALGGLDPSPYAASSAFALDPVYLSLERCEDFQGAGGRGALAPALRDELVRLEGGARVNWPRIRAIKQEALRLAFDHFREQEWKKRSPRAHQLADFMRHARHWLDDYALFAVLHQQLGRSWMEWRAGARDREPDAIARVRQEQAEPLLQIAWVQWQLDLQWQEARAEASRAGVDLMGDLPFMVGADSADVWANRGLFRTDLSVGTPPDDFSAEGQDWGLPVYDWPAFQRADFAWLRARAKRAGELFSLYRIDHVIGFYRTYFRSIDGGTSGFTPPDEGMQIRLGETVMRLMRRWGEVVAEDLGTVPPFLRPSLERSGVPGYKVLRWEKDGDVYRDPAEWPALSVATNATHDTDTTAEWYDALSADQRSKLAQIPALSKLAPERPFDDTVRDTILRAIYASPSTLTLVTFQDALGLRDRINVPGTVGDGNWTYRMDRDVDALARDRETTDRLRRLAEETGRG